MNSYTAGSIVVVRYPDRPCILTRVKAVFPRMRKALVQGRFTHSTFVVNLTSVRPASEEEEARYRQSQADRHSADHWTAIPLDGSAWPRDEEAIDIDAALSLSNPPREGTPHEDGQERELPEDRREGQ